jgi:hypothetical protein
VTDTGGPRYFDAVVDVVDDDDPAFAAWVSVSDNTVEIHAFDITLGSWNTSDVRAVSSDDGVLLEVPGSVLCIRSATGDELLSCLTGGVDTSAA